MNTVPRGRLRALADPVPMSRYAAYAFMIVTPWAAVFASGVNPHDAARMMQTFVMCVSACALLRLGGPWWPRARKHRAALLAVLAVGCLSVATAEKPLYAALEASATVLLVAVSVVLARTRTDVLVRELPAVVAVSAVLAVLLELPRLIYFLADGRVPQAADFGFMYMSHRFLNHAQSVMLPMAFLPLLVPAPRWVRTAAWIGVIGGLALLWRTGGRGTLVAMAVFAVALPWVLRPRAKEVIQTLVRVAGGAAMAYGVCFMLPAALLSLAQDHRGSVALRIVAGDDSGRFYLWRLALDDAMQHPWLGIGPMHYAHLPNLLAAHPHNSLVQWAAEWGFPVTLGMLVAVCALLQRAVRQVANTTTPNGTTTLLAVAALATIAGGIDSLVSGTLVMPVSQTWWFIALGCMLACLSDRSAHVPVAGSMARWVLIVALLALHVGSSVLTYRRSVEPPQTTATGLQRNNVPRYWINGFF